MSFKIKDFGDFSSTGLFSESFPTSMKAQNDKKRKCEDGIEHLESFSGLFSATKDAQNDIKRKCETEIELQQENIPNAKPISLLETQSPVKTPIRNELEFCPKVTNSVTHSISDVMTECSKLINQSYSKWAKTWSESESAEEHALIAKVDNLIKQQLELEEKLKKQKENFRARLSLITKTLQQT